MSTSLLPLPPIGPDSPWLAPLAGFSDLPFRLLCRSFGCATAVTEMVSIKGLFFNSGGTDGLLATCAEDAPLVVQLFGAEEDYMERATAELSQRGHRYFDLNCGCSVAKVVKTGSGAALLKTPERLLRLVRAMLRNAGEGRVGVKLRLGYDFGQLHHIEIAKALEQEGVSWLALHPRFARQGFSGNADWSELARLKAAVGIPVIASGDIITAEDALRCIAETGVDGVMFARGALRDPAVFATYHSLRAGESPIAADGARLSELIRQHARLIRMHGDIRKDILKMRTILPRYVRDLEGAKSLRKEMVQCSTWERLDELCEEIAILPRAESPDIP